MSDAALARTCARCSTSVAAHSGNARLAVATASSTSAASPLGTLPTTSSVAGLTTSISLLEAACRHSPPISIDASTTSSPGSCSSASFEVRLATLTRGGEALAVVGGLQQRGLREALGEYPAALVDV